MHSKLWTDMFVLALPVAEKILRPIVVYFFLVIGLRLAGKRELAQLNPFDLVVLLTLSNTVQNAIIGDDNSVTGGIIGAATLLLVNYLVVRFLFRHEKLDRLVEGEATRADRTRKDPRGQAGEGSTLARRNSKPPRTSRGSATSGKWTAPRSIPAARFASPPRSRLRRNRATGNFWSGSIN